MDKFERQFEHLDVQTQTMEEAMSGVTTLTVPEVHYYICSCFFVCTQLALAMVKANTFNFCRIRLNS